MHYILLLCLFLLYPIVCSAQEDRATKRALQNERRLELKEFSKVADTSYYIPYHSQITGRLYLSRKTTSLAIKNFGDGHQITYRPNSTLNIGIGATYKLVTINIAYGFSFLNFLNPQNELGKTKYLDLQCHLYGRKIVIDGFGQFYRGFYASPKESAGTESSYYIRPDIKVNQVGISVQYVLNNRKFSYRASFLQNEWQKKSAGTLLFGFESYLGNIIADSTIIPTTIDSKLAQSNITQFWYFKTGPNAGYAYTLVYRKHLFLTGSITGNLGAGNNTIISDNGRENIFGISTSLFIRAFAGYNSDQWGISAVYTSNDVGINSGNVSSRITLNTTNIRLNFIYRFKPPKRVKNNMDKFDNMKKSIEEKFKYDEWK